MSKQYVFFLPYITQDGERKKVSIVSGPVEISHIEDMTAQAIEHAKSLIESENDMPIDIGYLVNSLDPWKAKLEELSINHDYLSVSLKNSEAKEDEEPTSTYVVNIPDFIFGLLANGITLGNNGNKIYAPSIIRLVEDGGFEATPQLELSRMISFEPASEKKIK